MWGGVGGREKGTLNKIVKVELPQESVREILLIKKSEIVKTKPTFILLVLKVDTKWS